ncbi:MAG: lipoprotein insertase outer membrane protein LolB [Methylovulum sp.]|uniref:lipoprotein insertase outer membrane protein LolB n=1 Tax=Methylovulum sp. TaxID=1916980 RepID=UPI002611F233|nr:lipoprotein insertase outer membrane protein LolB [Methylovulum sp.]MDD2724440.1 lipoprotein insertase outer membrane protein LolB [Methylovulum sp.]MDD5123681.1 lipoprotein insertase outer membrane protein LolB [Methylovulum sp.]
MWFVKIRQLAVLALVFLVSACSSLDVVPDGAYSRAAMEDLQPLAQWSLEGRLSLSGNKDSWSANLLWDHDPAQDQLKLSGPLGQGATLIRLNGGLVSIDRGGGKVQTSAQPEVFINQQLGMSIPIRALSYWIVGLPEPGLAFVDVASGFSQSGWMVEYKQMQSASNRSLPRKMTVMNEKVKLKLIIEQWVLNGTDGL